MHELSISVAMLDQVAALAVRHGASRVDEIRLRIGPLCGVEPALLRAAFLQCRAATPAAHARLVIVETPIRISCRRCGSAGDAGLRPLRLACGACASEDVQLLSGEEMMLESVELGFQPGDPAPSREQ